MTPSERLIQRREAKKSYHNKPRFRKATTLQTILGTTFAVPTLALLPLSYAVRLLDPIVGRAVVLLLLTLPVLGMLSGILFVCFMTLTGPVYKNQIDTTTNGLEVWGFADRLAAAIISLLGVSCILWIVYRVATGGPH